MINNCLLIFSDHSSETTGSLWRSSRPPAVQNSSHDVISEPSVNNEASKYNSTQYEFSTVTEAPQAGGDKTGDSGKPLESPAGIGTANLRQVSAPRDRRRVTTRSHVPNDGNDYELTGNVGPLAGRTTANSSMPVITN